MLHKSSFLPSSFLSRLVLSFLLYPPRASTPANEATAGETQRGCAVAAATRLAWGVRCKAETGLPSARGGGDPPSGGHGAAAAVGARAGLGWARAR